MTGPYCPGPGAGWERCEPADAGFDAGGMEAAVAFARGHESTLDRNIRRALENRAFGEPPPLGDIIGPTRPRGAPQGLVLAGGRSSPNGARPTGPTSRSPSPRACCRSAPDCCMMTG